MTAELAERQPEQHDRAAESEVDPAREPATDARLKEAAIDPHDDGETAPKEQAEDEALQQ